jgi:5,10-methenyltetrahydrofolate synthetase
VRLDNTRQATLPRPPNADWRKAERRRLIAARLAMSDAARAAASARLEAALTQRFAPGAFPVLAGYWPIQGEFDPLPYLRRVIEAGGAVALPVAKRPVAPLEFRLWTPGAPMTAGLWNIPHPLEGAAVRPSALLIPLVGFDGLGHRLGNGAGYYDRTLAAQRPRPFAIGVGFELGRLGSISPQQHDQPMDVIVTEAGAFTQQTD